MIFYLLPQIMKNEMLKMKNKKKTKKKAQNQNQTINQSVNIEKKQENLNNSNLKK